MSSKHAAAGPASSAPQPSIAAALGRLVAPHGPDTPDVVEGDDLRGVARFAHGLFRYLRPELRHADRIPSSGRALLVGNHALMGIDSFVLCPQIIEATGRLPRGLADFAIFNVPVIERAVRRLGAIPGTQDGARGLLEADELVLVYPGGSVDSFKPPEHKYQLPWAGRKGFIRLALATGTPIIPVMGAGIDDAYVELFRDRWVFPTVLGVDPRRYTFPVSMGLGFMPLPTRFVFFVGEPMAPPAPPEAAEDEAVVDAWHEEVWTRCQALLDASVETWRAERSASGARTLEAVGGMVEGLLRGLSAPRPPRS